MISTLLETLVQIDYSQKYHFLFLILLQAVCLLIKNKLSAETLQQAQKATKDSNVSWSVYYGKISEVDPKCMTS